LVQGRMLKFIAALGLMVPITPAPTTDGSTSAVQVATCGSDAFPPAVRAVQRSGALQQWYALRSSLLPRLYHGTGPSAAEREADCRNMVQTVSDVFPLDTFVVFPAWAGADLITAVFAVKGVRVLALSPIRVNSEFLLDTAAWNQLVDLGGLRGDTSSWSLAESYFCVLQRIALGKPPAPGCGNDSPPSLRRTRGGGYTATLRDSAAVITVDQTFHIIHVLTGVAHHGARAP
jgi:hypothetical protein